MLRFLIFNFTLTRGTVVYTAVTANSVSFWYATGTPNANPFHSRDDGSYLKARRNGTPVYLGKGDLEEQWKIKPFNMVRIHFPLTKFDIAACLVRSDYTITLLKWIY